MLDINNISDSGYENQNYKNNFESVVEFNIFEYKIKIF